MGMGVLPIPGAISSGTPTRRYGVVRGKRSKESSRGCSAARLVTSRDTPVRGDPPHRTNPKPHNPFRKRAVRRRDRFVKWGNRWLGTRKGAAQNLARRTAKLEESLERWADFIEGNSIYRAEHGRSCISRKTLKDARWNVRRISDALTHVEVIEILLRADYDRTFRRHIKAAGYSFSTKPKSSWYEREPRIRFADPKTITVA
jgi:hypothetical protein